MEWNQLGINHVNGELYGYHIVNKHLAMKDTNIINMQFKYKNVIFLWNRVKVSKKLKKIIILMLRNLDAILEIQHNIMYLSVDIRRNFR